MAYRSGEKRTPMSRKLSPGGGIGVKKLRQSGGGNRQTSP